MRLKFGDFVIDSGTRQLRRGGEDRHLGPKAFELLELLLRRRPNVVTKEAIRDALWPGTFVASSTLATVVTELRTALVDDPKSPRYLRTVHGVGYAFCGEAAEEGPPGPSIPEPSVEALGYRLLFRDREISLRPGENLLGRHAFRAEVDAWWLDRRARLESPSVLRRRRVNIALGVAAALAVLAAGTTVALRLWHDSWRNSRSSVGPSRPVQLTTFEGAELDPALSPDGGTVAFVWQGKEGGGFDLYVQPVGATTPARLTSEGKICCPTFSPDGRTLAFVRLADPEAAVFTIAAAGGPERRMATVRPWFGLGLSWSPDGARIVFPDVAVSGEPFGLVALSVDSLQETVLTRPGRAYTGDGFPAFSADGRTVAFSRVSASGDALPGDVYLLHEGDAEPRRLTFDETLIGGLAWSADGRDVLFTAVRKGDEPRIWRASTAESPARPAPIEGLRPTEVVAETLAAVSHDLRLGASRRSPRIVYVRGTYDTNIWNAAVPESGGSSTPHRLIASTLPDEAPQYSPDGQTIAFSTARSGNGEVWTCRRDGSSCSALTQSGVHSGTPRFSPDGRQIAFDSRPESQSDIFVVDLASRQARRVTTSPADDVVPSWSRDGRTLYFASNRTGRWEVWKTELAGERASQVTSEGGFAAFEGGDGLYFTKQSAPGLWRMPKGGGDATRIADGPKCWGHWALGPDGVYFLDARAPGRTDIELLGFGRTDPVRVASFSMSAPCAESSLAVSPDARDILYVAAEESANVMMAAVPR